MWHYSSHKWRWEAVLKCLMKCLMIKEGVVLTSMSNSGMIYCYVLGVVVLGGVILGRGGVTVSVVNYASNGVRLVHTTIATTSGD